MAPPSAPLLLRAVGEAGPTRKRGRRPRALKFVDVAVYFSLGGVGVSAARSEDSVPGCDARDLRPPGRARMRRSQTSSHLLVGTKYR
ncbi:zinc finger protein 689, isoform CRA_a [Mus musculus]|nr:zinc finger protein 689, isoform CRA_a [Mus musculus]EDL17536.1 zinc finger protein 689, isoform CRA_a [Mus musculus]